MPPLSRDAIFTVLSGLTALACDKAAVPTAEPAASVAPVTAAAAPAPVVSPSTTATPSSGGPLPSAREVPPATGKPAEKEKTCSPGGCAPGQCGANKK